MGRRTTYQHLPWSAPGPTRKSILAPFLCKLHPFTCAIGPTASFLPKNVAPETYVPLLQHPFFLLFCISQRCTPVQVILQCLKWPSLGPIFPPWLSLQQTSPLCTFSPTPLLSSVLNPYKEAFSPHQATKKPLLVRTLIASVPPETLCFVSFLSTTLLQQESSLLSTFGWHLFFPGHFLNVRVPWWLCPIPEP